MLDRQEFLGGIGQTDEGPTVTLEPAKVMTIADALWGINMDTGQRVTKLCTGTGVAQVPPGWELL